MNTDQIDNAIHYAETPYGFEYGAAKVERHLSDTKRGWVLIGVETPRDRIGVYVTRTGKIRVFDDKHGRELQRGADADPTSRGDVAVPESNTANERAKA